MPYHNYMIILGGSEVLQKSRWCAKGTTFLVCHTVNFRWYDRCGSSTLWLKIPTASTWNGNHSMQHCISSLMQSPEKGCAESKSETIAGHRHCTGQWPPPDGRTAAHPPSSDMIVGQNPKKRYNLGESYCLHLMVGKINNFWIFFRIEFPRGAYIVKKKL